MKPEIPAKISFLLLNLRCLDRHEQAIQFRLGGIANGEHGQEGFAGRKRCMRFIGNLSLQTSLVFTSCHAADYTKSETKSVVEVFLGI